MSDWKYTDDTQEVVSRQTDSGYESKLASALEVGTAVLPPDPPPTERIIAQYTAALDRHIDDVAHDDQWDNRITCIARAGYPNPWQQRAIAFGTWMDTCYALAYQIMAEVQGGVRQLPSIAEFIAEMPVMEWPA